MINAADTINTPQIQCRVTVQAEAAAPAAPAQLSAVCRLPEEDTNLLKVFDTPNRPKSKPMSSSSCSQICE